MVTQHPGRNQPERVVVRPGPDGGDDLVWLGGREHELQVGRGLLDDLEQSVEGRRGDHVRLVDDEHLEARRGGCEERTLSQITGVVDQPVGGGVDLGDVHADPTADRHALFADPARFRCRTVHAVQGCGKDARGRRLAAAARPTEQVGMVETAGAQRLHERAGDVLLADDLGEGRRTVSVVQRTAHWTTGLPASSEPRTTPS